MTSLLQVRNMNKSYGALKVTTDFSISVSEGELHAIIGPNGAGKTTLLSLLSGQISPDSGEIEFDGKLLNCLSMAQRARLGIARSFQITSIFPKLSVLENVAVAVQSRSGTSFSFFGKVAGERGLNEKAKEILSDVGLVEGLARPAGTLSHGERRQLEIAISLATSPRLLLLDEPLAGTSGKEVDLIVSLIARLKQRMTIILIEHDIGAVFSLADRISVLVYGTIIATGGGEEIRANPDVRQAYLGVEG